MKKSKLYLGLRRWWVAFKLITKEDSYLNSTGFIKSHQEISPIDKDGSPIPWMNYAMIEFLDKRLKPDMRMFEYGSGFSTQYFAARMEAITSVEYDRSWEDQVKELLDGVHNVKLIYRDVGEDYVKAAENEDSPFDLILVDGRERVACTKSALKALSLRGVVILDDSDRDEYQEAFEEARSMGFKSLTISGIKPFSFAREESTIFYRDGNCLDI